MLLAYAKSRDLDLSKRKGADGHRLGELLDGKLPEWAFLLLSAVQVDRRTKLFKRFEELGAALFLGLERDRYGKVDRDSLLNFISQRLRQAGKNIEPHARDLIVARAGDDLRTLQQELDKLLLYAAERPAIQPQDVEAVVADHGEGWIFDLTRAIGDRDALGALGQLSRLMGQGEHPLKILGTIAGEVRRLHRRPAAFGRRPAAPLETRHQLPTISADRRQAGKRCADAQSIRRLYVLSTRRTVRHGGARCPYGILVRRRPAAQVERRPTAVGDGKVDSRHVSGRPPHSAAKCRSS